VFDIFGTTVGGNDQLNKFGVGDLTACSREGCIYRISLIEHPSKVGEPIISRNRGSSGEKGLLPKGQWMLLNSCDQLN
jgi:hypothetical protein